MQRICLVSLNVPATAFCEKCQAEKCELPVDGKYTELPLFADNCWLKAMSPVELRCMARAWNELLVSAGLRLAWKEAVWCTSAPACMVADTISAKIITDLTRYRPIVLELI